MAREQGGGLTTAPVLSRPPRELPPKDLGTGQIIGPQAGPQEAFNATPADVCIFGGSAGGGKSYGVLLDLLRHVHRPGFGAVVFRRTFPELTGAGSLWEASHGIFRKAGGEPREKDYSWRWPSGALIQFRHMQHPKDRFDHQGKEYAGIYFDELTHFQAVMFWYLFSRNRSTCGVRPYIRATTNPDPDSFVRKLIDWWIGKDGKAIPERSGALRWFVRDKQGALVWGDTREEVEERTGQPATSLTFIRSELEDNKELLRKDPGYKAKLELLDVVERARLKDGDWNRRAAKGDYFKPDWYPRYQRIPGRIVGKWRGWDLAATEPKKGKSEPDWTRGVLLLKLADADVVWLIADVVSLRGSPRKVNLLLKRTARRDGHDTTISIWQDPGAAGKRDVEAIRTLLEGFEVRTYVTSQNKVAFARPMSAEAEAGRVGILEREWTDGYLGEHEQFPEGDWDDQIDATSAAHLGATREPHHDVEVDVADMAEDSVWAL